jgi:hypothetical protein
MKKHRKGMKFREIYIQDLKDEYLMNSSVGKILLVIHSPNASMSVEKINKLFAMDVDENDEIEFVFIEYKTLKDALDGYDVLKKAKVDRKYCHYDVWYDGKRARSTDDP